MRELCSSPFSHPTKTGRRSSTYFFSPGVYNPAKELCSSRADIEDTMQRTAALLETMHIPYEVTEKEEWRPFLL